MLNLKIQIDLLHNLDTLYEILRFFRYVLDNKFDKSSFIA